MLIVGNKSLRYYDCYSTHHQQGELPFYQIAVNLSLKGMNRSGGILVYQDRPLGETFGGKDAFLMLVYKQPWFSHVLIHLSNIY